MMKRIVYKKTNGFGYRPIAKGLSKGKNDLVTLFEIFDLHHEWMQVDKGIDQVMIWNAWDKEDYSDDNDIPKVILSRSNYDEIITAWNANIYVLKPYLILSQDDTGWINLETKDELSKEDLQAIEEDRKAGIEWEENWKRIVSENKIKKNLRQLFEKIKQILKF